jgi:hypothetical protein
MTNEKPRPPSKNLDLFVGEITADLIEICRIIDPDNTIADRYVEGYGFMDQNHYDAYMEKIRLKTFKFKLISKIKNPK